jgi:hypothetical protein
MLYRYGIVDVIRATDISLLSSMSCEGYFASVLFQGDSGDTDVVHDNEPYWNTNFCFDVDRLAIMFNCPYLCINVIALRSDMLLL